MHVGGIEVVLFVPGGSRQNDIGIDAGRGHAEIERDQKVELSFRRILMPHGLAAFLRAFLSQILPSKPLDVPSRCFRKYSCPLPDEPSRFERQTNMLRGQLASWSGSSQDMVTVPFFKAFAMKSFGSLPAAAASLASSSGLVWSCGAEGSQPIRSARML